MKFETEVSDGKYKVIFDNGKLSATRYGEEWRSLTGDNLIFSLAFELNEAREELAKLKPIRLEPIDSIPLVDRFERPKIIRTKEQPTDTTNQYDNFDYDGNLFPTNLRD